MSKKIISILLVAVMLFSFTSVAVSAEDPAPEEPNAPEYVISQNIKIAISGKDKFTGGTGALVPFNVSIDVIDKDVVPMDGATAENTYTIPKNDITLKKLITKDNAAPGGEQLIKTYLEQLLIILARDILGKKDVVIFPSKESMETYIISEIKKYIKSKVTQKLKIEDICRHFGYSKTYLSQLFKSQCSISLINYYNKEKITQ